jgi:hypothetical protein
MESGRIIATVVYLTSLGGTLAVAFTVRAAGSGHAPAASGGGRLPPRSDRAPL